MIGGALLLLQLAIPQAASSAAAMPSPPFAATAVSDVVLARQRGGIRLPNGVDVALSIDTVTAVNNAIVLQTVTKINSGPPVTLVYAPEDEQTVAFAGGQAAKVVGAQPGVTYDKQHGFQVRVGGASIPPLVSAANGKAVEGTAAGLRQIDPSAPVNTPGGVVQALAGGRLRGAELQGTDIRILHLSGGAVGSVIANSGSDRAIDTQTTLSIDLRNAGPDVLGSTMLRVEGVAIDALAGRF